MTDPRDSHGCGHVDDLLALLAIGSIEDDEREVAERHLADCLRCRAELQALESAAEALYRANLRAPSEDAWNRIEHTIADADSNKTPANLPAARRWVRWGSAAAAVAIFALLGGGAFFLLQSRNEESPLDQIQNVTTDDAVFTLAALSPDLRAAGRIFMSEDRSEGVVAVTGLAQLPDTERYAVWIVLDDDTRLSAGTFTVDGSGSAVAALALPKLQYDWTASGRYVALSISRVSVEEMNTPVGGPILVGPLY